MNNPDKKIFCTLFLAILAAVTGVGIVVPLLPVYAHEHGAGGFYIAAIFGAFSFSRTILLPYFGRLSDKKGRKNIITAGLFIYAVVSAAFLFADTINSLIIIRFLQGIGSAMIMPVAQAYVGDITPKGKEGWVMGLFNMSVFFGLSIGPLIGGAINDAFSINGAFICMGSLALAGFFLSLLLLPPVSSEKITRCCKQPVEWKLIIKDRDIIGLSFFRFSYTTCIGIIWGFLPVFADFEFSLSSSLIGVLVMLGVIVSGLLQIPMGYLADRMNKKIMIVIGGIITIYALLSFTWANGFRDLFIANALFGLGGGISMPALMAMIVIKGERADAMGSVMGLITMAHSSGMLVGAFLAGLMMDYFKLNQSFTLGAVVMLAGIALCAINTQNFKEQNRMAPIHGNIKV
jgi:MFS family permease